MQGLECPLPRSREDKETLPCEGSDTAFWGLQFFLRNSTPEGKSWFCE